jgi:hypothetical protein
MRIVIAFLAGAAAATIALAVYGAAWRDYLARGVG